MPEISIIVPVYNAGKFIHRAIKSVLSQTFTDFEILIIDDCSTDNTLEVAYKLQDSDSRIKVLKMQENGGPSAARNMGFLNAKGNWIALLDADDAFMFDRLEVLIGVALETNADLIADNLYLFDSSVKKISGVAYSFDSQITNLNFNLLLEHDQIGGKSRPLGWIKPIFKRSFLEQSDLKYREDLRYAEDFYFYSEFLLNGGKALLIDTPYYIYTTRQGELSGELSNQSQTVADFNSLSVVTQRLIDQFKEKLNDAELALLLSRIKSAKRMHYFYEFKQLLKHGKLIKSVLLLLKKPSVFKVLFRRIPSAILRRVKRLTFDQ